MLHFDTFGPEHWSANGANAHYTVTREPDPVDPARPWCASACLHDDREYSLPCHSPEAAMAACRRAESQGFDCWQAERDTPNTSVDAGEEPRAWTQDDWFPPPMCSYCDNRIEVGSIAARRGLCRLCYGE